MSFDRPARVIVFVCETAPGGLKLAEKEICAVRSDGTGLRRLTRPLRSDESQYNHAAAPAVSADGRLVVYRRQHAGYLGAVGTDGTGPRVLVPQADGLTPVVLARRAVFYLRDGQVWRAGLDGSGARQLTRERGEIRALAADQDGRRVAYVARESGRAAGITVVDGNTGAVLHTIPGVAPPGGWGPDQSLRVSGDGRRLLFAGQSGGRHGIYVVDLATRKVVEVSAGIKAGIGADLNETGEIAVMTREEGPPLALAFLPDETPPDLWIDDPRPGSSASGESVSVAIRYRDRAVVSGVDPATLTVLVNGRDVSVRLEKEPERASGRLGREFLKNGENVLEARIRDRAGNESRQTVRFHVVPGLLAEFHMAGGIAGIGQRLRVFRDGLARVDSDHVSYCARLDQERLERLRRTLDQTGFPGLRPEYRPAHPVVDGYTYRVAYQGHMVTTQDPIEDAAPAALRAV
ncbi:MAG: hypothetical protein QN194_12085, partial [Armatimonadota bacterium]|nr:hypothetical protein [Armatimonadota bacterium]